MQGTLGDLFVPNHLQKGNNLKGLAVCFALVRWLDVNQPRAFVVVIFMDKAYCFHNHSFSLETLCTSKVF